MKKIKYLIFLSLYFSKFGFAIDNTNSTDEPKIFSEKEFEQKVESEVMRRLAQVSGKSLKDFAASLLEKEKALKLKSLDVEKREQEMVIVEKNLEIKIKEFREQQDQIIGCINANEKESSTRIDHLVEVISSMKPANAAEILAVQDSSISVQIISKLKPDKVSKIFNLMDKEISARLQKSYINMKK